MTTISNVMRPNFRASVLLRRDESLVFRADTGQELRRQNHGRDEIRKGDADPHQCAGEGLISQRRAAEEPRCR